MISRKSQAQFRKELRKFRKRLGQNDGFLITKNVTDCNSNAEMLSMSWFVTFKNHSLASKSIAIALLCLRVFFAADAELSPNIFDTCTENDANNIEFLLSNVT